jgi:2-isopropylmalate synthase
VNAVQKIAHSYEHIDPTLVGNQRTVLISDLAGRSNIVMKAQELGFKLANDTPQLKTILQRIKDLEHQGYEFEAAEASLALLIRRSIHSEERPFKVNAYHVSMRRDGEASVCEATIKIQVGEKSAHTVAEGDGPVNALDSALRGALAKFYPEVKRVQLTDYKVRILDSATGTAAKTRVLIESTDGHHEWGTVGVSTNIIEASLEALVDSMEYKLVRGV